MIKFGIKNLRSIENMDSITLKPLTICVGRNSSGKSTFLRTFPLLKQSIEVKTSEPLLWYGPYIDFGSFKESLCRHSSEEEIRLQFEWKLNSNLEAKRWRYFRSFRRFQVAEGSWTKVELCIKEKYISQIDIIIDDQKVRIDSEPDGTVTAIYINDCEMFYQKKQKSLLSLRGNVSLLPMLVERGGNYSSIHMGTILFQEEWVRVLKKKAYKTTKDDTILQILRRLPFGNQDLIIYALQNIAGPELLKKELEKLNKNDSFFTELNNLIVGDFIPDILEFVNYLLQEEIESVKYIKPIRAMIDRYYRIKGIAIDELDSAGANLPMLFYNLTNSEKESFRKWTYEKFGVSFLVQGHDGHVSLILEDPESGERYNLADVGYGYSQVIPIIMQLWLITQKKRKNYGGNGQKLTLIIEQPELHLHPAFQAKLVDVFIAIIGEAQKNGFDLKLIFETHSETMVNRVGYLVEKDYISSEDVNVLIFDKHEGKTYIHEKWFNKNGILEKWPLGFFSPDKQVMKNVDRS